MLGFVTIVGLGFLLFGASLTLSNLRNLARRRRIIATPTSPINEAMGGMVEIKGRIVPGENGLLAAPLTGRKVVWARVMVEQQRSSGNNQTTWDTVLNEVSCLPFLVEDGSGEAARILPDGARVILDESVVASSGTFHDPPPQVEAFLRASDLDSKNFLGFRKTMRYAEELLAPGDALYAIGPSRRDPVPPPDDSFDIPPPNQLVMYADAGADAELILTNKTEKQLVSRLRWTFILGLAPLGVGAVIVLGRVIGFFSP